VSAQTGYQLKLTGPGLSLEKDVSEEIANRITLLVLSGGKIEQSPAGKGSGIDPASSGTKGAVGNKSVREYLQASNAKKIPQQMTVIGHHLLETHQKDAFSMEELLKGFSDAKESPPKNPNRDINTAIKRGWIALRQKDSYYVTSTGMKAIDDGFPEEPRKRRKKKAKSVAAKTK
jgi:hypothetical protein